MKDIRRVKKLYAIYDITMHMWTEPYPFRNDVEAKKAFERMLKDDVFCGCPVEFYCIGYYQIDCSSNVSPIFESCCERLYVASPTIDDGDGDGDGGVSVEQPDCPGIGAQACSFESHEL